MATKPAVLEQQRNRDLRGVPTSAPLPAMVDSDGRIINAAGFAGYIVEGGPVIQTAPVLSLPDSDCALTADQVVGTHLFAGRLLASRIITLPGAADILKYLTTANSRSSYHLSVDDTINPGTAAAPGAVVPEAAAPLPFFQTVVSIANGMQFDGNATVRFKSDLSVLGSNASLVILPANPGIYTLTWYILNVPSAAAPTPQIAIVVSH